MFGKTAREAPLEALNTEWGAWDEAQSNWIAKRNRTLATIETHLAEVRRMENSVEADERQIKLCADAMANINTAYGLVAAHFGPVS